MHSKINQNLSALSGPDIESAVSDKRLEQAREALTNQKPLLRQIEKKIWG